MAVALILCSLVVLGLSAHLTSKTEQVFHPTVSATLDPDSLGIATASAAFEGLGIATAAITIATVPLMVGMELTRKGAFTSMVVVELTWLGILWVLWLVTGARTIRLFDAFFSSGCHGLHNDKLTFCRETQAIAAFGFLSSGIILMFYWIFLFAASITAASHGNSQVWFSSVHDMNVYDSKDSVLMSEQTHNTGTMQSHHTQQV
ncbi:hypothetical protein K435DRAFT_840752 [Dendrothele bispora CBS 962.96]|uniref:MARVEL domain-containing protein n=1 Tax=Dendrothele bispora (strain CBS 962.96) TaxID=1314807 RepID=A0A4S8LRS5_DENBC|nr:hypothetical protein K435DRAFT_840752 [Dendrothele bispora CBS 962.96]